MTGSAKTAALPIKDTPCYKSSTRLQTAKKLTQTKHMSGSKTTAPVTAAFTTISESATLRVEMLSTASFPNLDMQVIMAKHSYTAENMALKPLLSREHGKILKTGSVTKQNNRPPEKAGGFFGEYNAAMYYCTLLKNVSRCRRILTDAVGVCQFLVSVT